MSSIYIAALGSHHPDERVTNADLIRTLDTTDEWILERTGIVERRRVAAGELTSHLGAAATRQALEQAGWAPEDLELLVCATSSPDAMLPSSAAHIGHHMGIDPVAFDVNAACSGFAYGLATARGMMQSMGYRRGAVCCSDVYTSFVDYSDRRTAILFGDGAATALLQIEPVASGLEVVDISLESLHAGLDHVRVPVNGTWYLDGSGLRKYANSLMAQGARRMLERNALKVGDLKAFIAHQANYRMLEDLAKQLEVTAEQHWTNVEVLGNQGGAGSLTTLAEGIRDPARELRHGDLILLTVVGSGYSAGVVLLRWIDQA